MVKMIGYWITAFDDRDFIAPQELEGEYPAHVRSRVVEYLHGGRLLEAYGGRATCRYPACKHSKFEHGIGSGEFTDGVWAWPEGLFHYIEAHSVTLPAEFVAHATENSVTPRTYDDDYDSSYEQPDLTFWIDWCAKNGSGIVRRRIEGLREQADSAVARATSEARAAFEAKCLDLERRRGLSSERCRWKQCESRALHEKAFCARHCEQDGLERDLFHARALVLRRFLDRCLALT
jgi:hypothetical protein